MNTQHTNNLVELVSFVTDVMDSTHDGCQQRNNDSSEDDRRFVWFVENEPAVWIVLNDEAPSLHVDLDAFCKQHDRRGLTIIGFGSTFREHGMPLLTVVDSEGERYVTGMQHVKTIEADDEAEADQTTDDLTPHQGESRCLTSGDLRS